MGCVFRKCIDRSRSCIIISLHALRTANRRRTRLCNSLVGNVAGSRHRAWCRLFHSLLALQTWPNLALCVVGTRLGKGELSRHRREKTNRTKSKKAIYIYIYTHIQCLPFYIINEVGHLTTFVDHLTEFCQIYHLAAILFVPNWWLNSFYN